MNFSDDTVRSVDGLSTLALAGQTLVAGFPDQPPEEFRRAIARGELAGATFFKRNIPSAHALWETLRTLRFPEPLPPLFAIDQEGGRVQRLGPPVLQLPAMAELARGGAPERTRSLASELGAQLRALGLTMNFAPVLDVHTYADNPVIGDRAFGTTPAEVIPQALAFAEGLAEAGMLACGKHFPGHGDTSVDSHLGLPVVEHKRARLEAVELAPFRAALHLPAIMSAHIVMRAFDDVPATLSKTILHGLLREGLGFEGAIISDDLEMKAVAATYSLEDASERALRAGCDVLLICSDLDGAFRVREHLAARAEQDDVFRARLREAALRSLHLRRQAPPRPSQGPPFTR